jgi:endonuclease/exonuclease/phosphatase (EEP) superfamily protein YafD
MPARGRTSAAYSVGQGVLGFGIVSVGVVATVATIVGFFGSAWWLFDYVANFRAHLALALLVVAVAYALLFSKTMSLIFLAFAVVNALVILPLYTDSPAEAVDTDEGMTIVSFNVAQRASLRDATFLWLDTVDADLVLLTEATDDWVAAEGYSDKYSSHVEMPPDRTFGITVYSDHSVTAELVRASSARDYAVRIETEIGNRPIVVYGVQSRPASDATSAALRDEYLTDIARMAKGETLPTVVVGDLEASPWSHVFRYLESEADLTNSLRGYGIQATWPADRWAFVRIPMDHLLHSSELTTVDRYLGPSLGVDHRPIVVRLAEAA